MSRALERIFIEGGAGRIETIVVIPGADHFFHMRLHVIRNVLKGSWWS
jgi:alpha/beta superfamily hydrolase